MKASNHKSSTRRIRKKNDVLKSKIQAMGGIVGVSSRMPAELENGFLKSVFKVESGVANAKKIKVVDRLGKDFMFKPINEINAGNMADEWNALSEQLNNHGIDIVALNPDVTPGEMYRFTVEELFQIEIDDINIPGMMSCFIYDEFYPGKDP